MSIARDRSTAPPLAGGWRLPFSPTRGGHWRRLRLSLSVAWNGAALDRLLAVGASPWTCDALVVRARQITSPRSRSQLSAGLTGLLHSAHDRTPVRSAAVRPPAPEVLEAEAVICDVARRLRAPEPVAAQGVAMVRALLTDGNALLYQSGAPGALHSRLRAAAEALEPQRDPDPGAR